MFTAIFASDPHPHPHPQATGFSPYSPRHGGSGYPQVAGILNCEPRMGGRWSYRVEDLTKENPPLGVCAELAKL